MACSHHNSSTCCCSHHRCTTPLHPQPPPPPPPADPFLVQSIVSQVVLLLQNPQIGHLSKYNSPSVSPPPPYSSPHQTQQRPKHEHPLGEEDHHFHNQYSALLQRIHLLESSIHRFSSSSSSSSSSFSLRHVAARTIQIHFRAHLVRRSTALRDLKELASIKSALNLLRSSFSLHNPLHFVVSLSHESLHLIRRLDAVKSGDQMVRDSKSSIRRDISCFLGLVDEICTKKTAFELKKTVKMVRNDDKSRVSCAARRDDSSGTHRRGKASKHRNLDTDEKRLVDNLRERVERIHQISKSFEDDEEEEDNSDDDVRGSNINYTNQCPRRDLTGKRRLQLHAERRGWFPEDGNATRVYDIHDDGEVSMRRVSGIIMERREESVNDKQHEGDGEVESDSEENGVESAEDSLGKDEAQSATMEGSSQGSEAEVVTTKYLTDESNKKVNASHACQRILSAPPPVKMEGRADLVKKHKAVKMVG